MGKRDGRVSCREAREMDMVDYLSALGHEPFRTRGHNFWYLSPLRSEKTASFKINRKLNRWYDHGSGKGGNLIDFATRYHGCTVAEFLAGLRDDFSFQQPTRYKQVAIEEDKAETGIEIAAIKPLSHPALLHYLHNRGVPADIAARHCREVHYRYRDKQYFAIGFANDNSGYELRSSCFKGSSSPKGISTARYGNSELAVFEGFMDFLSFIVMKGWRQPYPVDVLVLNSLAFFEAALPFMEPYARIRLYLDNDAAGQNCSRRAMASSEKFFDASSPYKNYKDLNEFLLHTLKPGLPKKPGYPEPP